MRTLRFYKMSPGGNSTILVLDPVFPADRASLARQLLDPGHLQAEQVGYLDLRTQPVRLDMMGGEFCANACRAAAAVMHQEGVGLIQEYDAWVGSLQASGALQPLSVRVQPGVDGLNTGVQLSVPQVGACTHLAPGIGLVRLPGIVHICLEEHLHPFSVAYETGSTQLRQRFGLEQEDAVGCIWYRQNQELWSIKPVVWVRSTNSTYFETGCGSGSLALALWLQQRQNLPMPTRILQPSGAKIHVWWTEDHKAWIAGPVQFIARGETWV